MEPNNTVSTIIHKLKKLNKKNITAFCKQFHIHYGRCRNADNTHVHTHTDVETCTENPTQTQILRDVHTTTNYTKYELGAYALATLYQNAAWAPHTTERCQLP